MCMDFEIVKLSRKSTKSCQNVMKISLGRVPCMSFGFFQNPSRSEKENNFKVQVATDQICCKWNFLATFKVRTALDHNFLAKKVDKYAYMLYRSKTVKIFRAKTKRRKVPWVEVAIGKNFTLNLVQQKVAHASSMPQVTPEVLNYGLWSRPMGWLGLLGSKKSRNEWFQEVSGKVFLSGNKNYGTEFSEEISEVQVNISKLHSSFS